MTTPTDTAKLLQRIRDQEHDLCIYERKNDTIIRLRRQRIELAKIAREAIDEIDTLRARVGELEGALQELVDLPQGALVLAEPWQRARTALQGTQP